jgi:Na+/melibiose symporter-like transporter
LGAMTLFTLVAGAAVLKDGESYRGWPGMAMLGVCWIVVLAVIWNFFRCRSRDTGKPLRDTISASLARNQAARRNYRVFCMMLPVFMMPLWVAIQRLQADDTMNTPAGWQAMAVCGVALAASLGWNTLRYFWVMKPEQRRLEALLEEYEG